MRSFINYLLTILLFIAVIITIIIFSIGNLTSENNTREMLDNINYDVLINDFKDSKQGSELYNYANSYGIDEKQVDLIIQSEEAKDYINEIIQKGINVYLNNSNHEFEGKTKDFVDKTNDKYELNLDDNKKKEIETYVDGIINNNLSGGNNNDDIDSEFNNDSFLIDIIRFCRNNNLLTTLYITIAFISMLLFISSFKKKNFLEYIGIVSIIVALSTLLFNGLISFMRGRINDLDSFIVILKPIIDGFYMITFVTAVLGICLFVVQHFINKYINKEKVPF